MDRRSPRDGSSSKSVKETLSGEDIQLISHVYKKMHDDSVKSNK